ncbi:MAG: toll/interleukin-1 receptor domain-containing protein [Caulobacterales bacterium]
MAFFTESKLRQFAASRAMERRSAQFLFESKEAAPLTVFLSHSHLDRVLAKGIVIHMGSLGVEVYVDWNDQNMPRETNRLTALMIKRRIREASLFVMLATKNALASRWVPWEVGIADAAKGQAQVLIIPVADSLGVFRGREFLRLYGRVEIADDGDSAVFLPGKNAGGVALETYMEALGT